MPDDTTVAVLGTGIMGAAMVRNILASGMEVRAWNRSREKAEPLENDGAEVADNPADAARAANFLLTMLADADVIEEAVQGDVLSALAEDGVWLGEAGEGSGLKLVVNNWIVGLLGVLAETVAFAEATGVDPAKFLETIEGGPLGLPYAQIKGNMMVEEDFPSSFSANLARKDANFVLDAAGAHDLHMGIAEAVVACFDEAIQAGHGNDDMAVVYRAARPDRG